jgi:hypothetical protein
MGTVKKLIGVGVVTGIVLYAYLRKFNAQLNRNELAETDKASAQLV